MSPFLQRIQSKTLPVADLTRTGTVAGGTCSFCGAEFASAQQRNLHMVRRHTDRRAPWRADGGQE